MEKQTAVMNNFTEKVQKNHIGLEIEPKTSQKQQNYQQNQQPMLPHNNIAQNHKNQQEKLQMQKQNSQKNKKINKHRKKKQEQIIYKNLNPFKEQEKHYKLYQDKQTDFTQLFDISTAQKFQVENMIIYNLPAPENGAYLIKGFNDPQTVNKIGYLALNQFWKAPYRTNLNSRNQLYQENGNKKETQVKQQHINIEHQITKQEFQTQIKEKGYCFNDKIRWANVGHQYDWTLRKYPQKNTPMHQEIKKLTDKANLVFNKLTNQNREYHPESAIVNYYGAKDYMTGHLDDAEYDQVSPIYSFSFGLSCIFLMGAMNKDVKPLAVRLDSGDLLIMSKNSRKCYHGVPRVIAGSYQQSQNLYEPKQVQQNFNSPKQVQKYFQNHRLNINIRQVFPQN